MKTNQQILEGAPDSSDDWTHYSDEDEVYYEFDIINKDFHYYNEFSEKWVIYKKPFMFEIRSRKDIEALAKLEDLNKRLERGMKYRLLDHMLGTPCAEIRWSQKLADKDKRIAELESNQAIRDLEMQAKGIKDAINVNRLGPPELPDDPSSEYEAYCEALYRMDCYAVGLLEKDTQVKEQDE